MLNIIDTANMQAHDAIASPSTLLNEVQEPTRTPEKSWHCLIVNNTEGTVMNGLKL